MFKFKNNKEINQFNDFYLRKLNIIIPIIFVVLGSLYIAKDLSYGLDYPWIDISMRSIPVILLNLYWIKNIRSNPRVVKFLLIFLISFSLISNTLILNFAGFPNETYGSGIACGFAIIGFLALYNLGVSFIILIIYALLNIILDSNMGLSFAHINYAVNPLRPMFSYTMVYLGCVVYSLYTRRLLYGLFNEKQKMETLSLTDPLTNCYNRLYLNKIKTVQNKTILMCDVNKFKNFNDTYGHHIGDLVLIEVVNTLRNNLSDDSTIIRYGGDEFVIITNNDFNIKDFAKKVNTDLDNVEIDNNKYDISISIGHFIIKGEPINIYFAINNADKKMYTFKK